MVAYGEVALEQVADICPYDVPRGLEDVHSDIVCSWGCIACMNSRIPCLAQRDF
jgi:hypothetical protein